MADQLAPEWDLERTRLALAGTRLGLWEWNMETGAAVYDERWAQIVGLELVDLPPATIQTWRLLAHPEDLRVAEFEMQRHAKAETDRYEADIRLRHADGSWIWVRDRGLVVERAANGQAVRMVGTHEDITESVVAHQELVASERRFASMFYDHEAVMLLVDPGTGLIIDANRAAASFYGYDQDELREMSITAINILPPDQVSTRYHEASARKREHFVFPHRLADGTVRTVDVHSSPIEEHGRVVLFSIILDVTEDEQHQAETRQESVVFKNIPDAVAVIGPDGTVLRINSAFSAISGWSDTQIVGSGIEVFVASVDFGVAELAAIVRGGSTVRQELQLRYATGAVTTRRVSFSPFAGPMGDPAGCIMLVTPATDPE